MQIIAIFVSSKRLCEAGPVRRSSAQGNGVRGLAGAKLMNMEQIDISSEGKLLSRVVVGENPEAIDEYLAPYPHLFAVMDAAVAMSSAAAAQMASVLNRRGVPGKLIRASEEHKTLDTVMDICGWLLENGADRDALVLAVGGGITTDMTGLAASLYKRGVRFAFVPTTLLAQVDAAIGGKTGVNFEKYKNILGMIRQPEFTYICPQVLESLPYRDFLSGAAEMLKTFMIEDDGHYQSTVDLLFRMQRQYVGQDSNISWSECVMEHVPEILPLVSAAAAVKAGVVSRDQFEGGERRKLNLGHTFAHAIETLAQRYPQTVSQDGGIVHGEAVAMGMVLAARLADIVYCDSEGRAPLAAKVEKDLLECGISCVAPFPVEEMAEVMSKDKKAEGGKVRFILPYAIGDVRVCELAVEDVVEFLKR